MSYQDNLLDTGNTISNTIPLERDGALWLLRNQGELAYYGLSLAWSCDGSPAFAQLSKIKVPLMQVPESLRRYMDSPALIGIERDKRQAPFRWGLKFSGFLKLSRRCVRRWNPPPPGLTEDGRLDIDAYLNSHNRRPLGEPDHSIMAKDDEMLSPQAVEDMVTKPKFVAAIKDLMAWFENPATKGHLKFLQELQETGNPEFEKLIAAFRNNRPQYVLRKSSWREWEAHRSKLNKS